MAVVENKCIRGAISICSARRESMHDYWTEQKECAFYEKATQFKKCMYNIFDKYCDCLEAQMDAKKAQPIKKEKGVKDLISKWEEKVEKYKDQKLSARVEILENCIKEIKELNIKEEIK